ncbi:hypothetical protein BKA64DRAFT_715523 [Cadophora sp. MPI-SDFR-AT-0126]|nr:hypothetical protein BKA64DRAFT_715523 [Leotiomycetes sp. MPI-SDFR-AT-0126]
MYGSPLRYAQSFEQLPQFKQEMALEEYPNQLVSIDFSEGSIEWDFLTEHLNPFKESGCNHPVEAALMLARTYADNGDGQQFKVERAAVIEYPEFQFQRVSAAASAIVSFVKEEKCSGGIFDCWQATWSSDEECATICASTMMLLEEYDTAFKRDMPFDVKVKFRQFRSQFERVYATTGVGITQALLIFKAAVDRLDNLFLEMLRARRELFMWDAPTFDDRQCTIDPQIERSSESIDWECNEPNMTPVSFDDYELSDAGHSNWSTQDSQDNESDDGTAFDFQNDSLRQKNDSHDRDSNEDDDTESEAGESDQNGLVENAQDDDVTHSDHEDVEQAGYHAEQTHADEFSGEHMNRSTEVRLLQEISGHPQDGGDGFKAVPLQSEEPADIQILDSRSYIQQSKGHWSFGALFETQNSTHANNSEPETPEWVI